MARAIVAEAFRWVGTPYRGGASRRGTGCDCVGLVFGVWRALHGTDPERLPPIAPDWADAGQGEPLLEGALRHCAPRQGAEAEPGDLLVFRWRRTMPATHAGIFAGDNAFIHAYRRGGVRLSPLGPHWRRRIAGVFIFPGI